MNIIQRGNRLRLEGKINIDEAARLKEILLKHLATEASMIINLEGVTQIDTSGIQILYAAHQSAAQQGKKLSLENPSPVFRETVKLAGLFFHASGGYLEGCLWQAGV